MRQSALVRDTQLDWNEQVRSVQVHVDQDKARLLGLSTADVQGLVQTALDGAPVTQIRRGEELIDVVVRATPEERKSIGQLGDLQVFSRNGVTVPLAPPGRGRSCPASSRASRSRCCGGATATWRSPCAATWSMACRARTPRRTSGP